MLNEKELRGLLKDVVIIYNEEGNVILNNVYQKIEKDITDKDKMIQGLILKILRMEKDIEEVRRNVKCSIEEMERYAKAVKKIKELERTIVSLKDTKRYEIFEKLEKSLDENKELAIELSECKKDINNRIKVEQEVESKNEELRLQQEEIDKLREEIKNKNNEIVELKNKVINIETNVVVKEKHDEIYDKITNMIEKGYTKVKIANELGLSRQAVYDRIKRMKGDTK